MEFSPLILQAAPGGGFGGTLLMMAAIILIFWFFLIRPQMKRHKQHQQMVNSVERGDSVVTGGGLVGKVTRVLDNEVEVEIAEGVKVRVIKQTLSDVPDKNPQQQKAPPPAQKKK